MNFTVDEINHIRLENPNSLTAQSFMLLKKWVSREGKNATSKPLSDFFHLKVISLVLTQSMPIREVENISLL